MIKHVVQYQVSSIFSDGGEKTYKIPKYQREYTWGQKEWDALFNDIVENDEGYFWLSTEKIKKLMVSSQMRNVKI